MGFDEITKGILTEIQNVLKKIDDVKAEAFVETILSANRIFCHSCGREGIVMRAFAMRLMHLGLSSHVVGDMTTPPACEGDLLIVSVGPGLSHTIAPLMEVAKANGGKIVFLTAHPESDLANRSDLVIHLPAHTMAKEESSEMKSFQPMGSLYEQSLFIYLDAIIVRLMEKMNQTEEAMARRHTNLE